MVHWLGLGAITAVGLASIPGWGTKILQAMDGTAKNKIKIKAFIFKKYFILKNSKER